MKEVTNAQGWIVWKGRDPEPASVVLVGGEHGNAWQLYASDGLWHRGKAKWTWEQILRERNVLLVYNAPPKVEQRPADLFDVLSGVPGCRACEISGVTCHNHKTGAAV